MTPSKEAVETDNVSKTKSKYKHLTCGVKGCDCNCHIEGSDCGYCNGISINEHYNLLNAALSQAQEAGKKEEREHIITEIKQVCLVHKYLSKPDCQKIVRFLENLDKPQTEMSNHE